MIQVINGPTIAAVLVALATGGSEEFTLATRSDLEPSQVRVKVLGVSRDPLMDGYWAIRGTAMVAGMEHGTGISVTVWYDDKGKKGNFSC